MFVRRIEGVAEDQIDPLHRRPVGVTWHRIFHGEAIGTNVVEAVEVIGVTMGKQHCIDAVDFVPQRLGAEIGSGIHQDHMVAIFQEDRAP